MEHIYLCFSGTAWQTITIYNPFKTIWMKWEPLSKPKSIWEPLGPIHHAHHFHSWITSLANYNLFTVSDCDIILTGGKQSKNYSLNVWEKLKLRCPVIWEWLTFWRFHDLQGKDTCTQQKCFLITFQERRFAVRWGISTL